MPESSVMLHRENASKASMQTVAKQLTTQRCKVTDSSYHEL